MVKPETIMGKPERTMKVGHWYYPNVRNLALKWSRTIEYSILEKECSKEVFPSKWRCKSIFVG